MDQTKRADALAFLKRHYTGTLATLSPDGSPRARTVYYACDADFNIYFLTFITTRKAEDLEKHAKAAFVISDESVPQTLQLEGAVADVTDATIDEPAVHELFGKLKSNETYFAPLAHLDAASVRFYRLTPSWVRWGDFTSGMRTEDVLFTLVG